MTAALLLALASYTPSGPPAIAGPPPAAPALTAAPAPEAPARGGLFRRLRGLFRWDAHDRAKDAKPAKPATPATTPEPPLAD
jgi:hypothetical protein